MTIIEPGDEAAPEPSPKPHRDKLGELLTNEELPDADKDRIAELVTRYEQWIADMDALESAGDQKVTDLVALLNDYKRFIELDVIWDSGQDFLYRQRGQLKLDNSVIEEFLPRLVDPAIIPALEGQNYVRGPKRTFAAAYFVTSLNSPAAGAGLSIRQKDQDFTVAHEAFLQASYSDSFLRGCPARRGILVAVR